jgi:hypothetical protein
LKNKFFSEVIQKGLTRTFACKIFVTQKKTAKPDYGCLPTVVKDFDLVSLPEGRTLWLFPVIAQRVGDYAMYIGGAARTRDNIKCVQLDRFQVSVHVLRP